MWLKAVVRHNKINNPRKLLLINTVNYRSHALRGNAVFNALRPVFTTQSISGCVTTRSVGTMNNTNPNKLSSIPSPAGEGGKENQIKTYWDEMIYIVDLYDSHLILP